MIDEANNTAPIAPSGTNANESAPGKRLPGRPKGKRPPGYVPSRIGDGTDPEAARKLLTRALGVGRWAGTDRWHARAC